MLTVTMYPYARAFISAVWPRGMEVHFIRLRGGSLGIPAAASPSSQPTFDLTRSSGTSTTYTPPDRTRSLRIETVSIAQPNGTQSAPTIVLDPSKTGPRHHRQAELLPLSALGRDASGPGHKAMTVLGTGGTAVPRGWHRDHMVQLGLLGRRPGIGASSSAERIWRAQRVQEGLSRSAGPPPQANIEGERIVDTKPAGSIRGSARPWAM